MNNQISPELWEKVKSIRKIHEERVISDARLDRLMKIVIAIVVAFVIFAPMSGCAMLKYYPDDCSKPPELRPDPDSPDGYWLDDRCNVNRVWP